VDPNKQNKGIRPSMRGKVLAALSQLVGLPLTAARRAADMRTFQFGELRPVRRGSVGDISLHIQCPWRVDGPHGIITGRMDLWEPIEDKPELDRELWDCESGNLQDFCVDLWLGSGESPTVESVDADEFGGATIKLRGGFAIRLFPAGLRGEDWRMFRHGIGAHFVIIGGKVSAETEWHRFIESTAGSITDPTFVRHPQGELEKRDPLTEEEDEK
jgi:hypothetical protein